MMTLYERRRASDWQISHEGVPQFQQDDGSWFNYTGLFVVLDMKENEVITGHPAILKEL